MPDDASEPTLTPQQIARLITRLQDVEHENEELRAKVVAMDAQLRRLVRRAFAPRSETLIHHPGQAVIDEVAEAKRRLRLAAEAAAAAPSPVPMPAPAPAAQHTPRQPRAPRGRGLHTLPDHLERIEERVELPPERRRDHDGTPLVPVGTERAERLDWEPGRFIRRVTLRTRYGRMDTREPVLTAPVPPAIVPKGLGGDRLVLHIAHQKYGMGMPLYRQRIEWLRQGVALSTQTACSWMDHLSRRLTGVIGAVRQQILAHPVLHLDDTPIRWRKPDRRSCQTARLWCYTAGDQVFFDFTEGRAGHWPRDLLGGYRGRIVADAYGGHDRLFTDCGGTATEVGCWAHARRPFRELVDRSDQALTMVQLVQGLYAIDDTAQAIADERGSDPVAERTALRRSEAPHILGAIAARADAIIASEPRQSGLADGARYMRTHWTALTRFAIDGSLPLDNNAAERQQRPVAVGRKAWLFVASEDGGHWAAGLLGIFQTCRLQHIDPMAYLLDIMPAVIAGDVDPLTLTPASYAARHTAKAG